MSILDEANTIIYGDREKTYGDPTKNLETVAHLWRLFILKRYGTAIPLTAEDMCHMMTLLKIARLINTPGHHDSLVDICGYTALVERIHANQSQASGTDPSGT